MEREYILEHLRGAKTAHIRWVQKAKLLISGLEVSEDAIPIDSTECKFGKWFYSDGQVLNALSNNPLECMQNIESLHFNLHDTYLKIFSIYFSQAKKIGFFAKLLGSKKKEPSVAEKEFAQGYYQEMEDISKNLLVEINRLERRIIAISEDQIQSLV